jgi:hypothetical protein
MAADATPEVYFTSYTRFTYRSTTSAHFSSTIPTTPPTSVRGPHEPFKTSSAFSSRTLLPSYYPSRSEGPHETIQSSSTFPLLHYKQSQHTSRSEDLTKPFNNQLRLFVLPLQTTITTKPVQRPQRTIQQQQRLCRCVP